MSDHWPGIINQTTHSGRALQVRRSPIHTYIHIYTPTHSHGILRALQCVMSLSGVLCLTFPIGVVSGELDRAYTKHFKALKTASDARHRALLEEARRLYAKAARAQADKFLASSIVRFMRNMIRARLFTVRTVMMVVVMVWMCWAGLGGAGVVWLSLLT